MPSELGELIDQAKTVILQRIIDQTPFKIGATPGTVLPPLGVLALAEAYAYLHNPNVSHGGGSNPR